MKHFILLFLIINCLGAKAQGWANNNRFATGTWQTLNVKYELHPKINLFAEGQFRSQEFYTAINYWEVKTFAHYVFTDQFSGGFGVGTYHQYADYENFKAPQKQIENRVWVEFNLKSKGGRIIFDHRYRFEDRFIQKWDATLNDFTSNHTSKNDEDNYRFRYRLQAMMPINNKTLVANTFYLNVSDEVMFTQKVPYFNQNRFFTGIGYKFEHSSIQVGVLHQFLKLPATERRKDYLQITFSKTFKRSKK